MEKLILSSITSRINFGIIVETKINKIILKSIRLILKIVNYIISKSKTFRINLFINIMFTSTTNWNIANNKDLFILVKRKPKIKLILLTNFKYFPRVNPYRC